MSMLWVNDELVDSNIARVSPLDHGFTVADGVFETLKVVDGIPFAVDRHLARLQRSAHGLGLGDIDVELVSKAIAETLAGNDHLELGRLRITITSGDGPLGSNRGPANHTLTVLTAPVTPWSDTTSIVVVPWRRNERSAITGLKTTSYAENVVALEAAHDSGFSEAIFLDTQDRLSEGTGTNIFFVTNGIAKTPSMNCGLLAGITRELALELCAAHDVVVEEGEYSLEDLFSADEVFITSSTRDIHPVTQLAHMDDNRHVSQHTELATGSITSSLRRAFAETYQKNVNP